MSTPEVTEQAPEAKQAHEENDPVEVQTGNPALRPHLNRQGGLTHRYLTIEELVEQGPPFMREQNRERLQREDLLRREPDGDGTKIKAYLAKGREEDRGQQTWIVEWRHHDREQITKCMERIEAEKDDKTEFYSRKILYDRKKLEEVEETMGRPLQVMSIDIKHCGVANLYNMEPLVDEYIHQISVLTKEHFESEGLGFGVRRGGDEIAIISTSGIDVSIAIRKFKDAVKDLRKRLFEPDDVEDLRAIYDERGPKARGGAVTFDADRIRGELKRAQKHAEKRQRARWLRTRVVNEYTKAKKETAEVPSPEALLAWLEEQPLYAGFIRTHNRAGLTPQQRLLEFFMNFQHAEYEKNTSDESKALCGMDSAQVMFSTVTIRDEDEQLINRMSGLSDDGSEIEDPDLIRMRPFPGPNQLSGEGRQLLPEKIIMGLNRADRLMKMRKGMGLITRGIPRQNITLRQDFPTITQRREMEEEEEKMYLEALIAEFKWRQTEPSTAPADLPLIQEEIDRLETALKKLHIIDPVSKAISRDQAKQDKPVQNEGTVLRIEIGYFGAINNGRDYDMGDSCLRELNRIISRKCQAKGYTSLRGRGGELFVIGPLMPAGLLEEVLREAKEKMTELLQPNPADREAVFAQFMTEMEACERDGLSALFNGSYSEAEGFTFFPDPVPSIEPGQLLVHGGKYNIDEVAAASEKTAGQVSFEDVISKTRLTQHHGGDK